MKYLILPDSGKPRIVDSQVGIFDAAGVYAESQSHGISETKMRAHFRPGPEPHLDVRLGHRSFRVVEIDDIAAALRSEMNLGRGGRPRNGRKRTAGDA